MSLQPDQVIGHYRVIEKIGEGGMGEVYRAEDTRLGREVALKLLPADLALDQDRRSRFEREARAVAALKHPNIVTIYSVEESDGVPFFTMELVEGSSLSGMIPSNGFPLSRFFEVALPLADAISSAHEKGITHRDLKPDNIMLDNEGRLKVLDFGLAKLTQPSSGTETAATLVVSDSATKEGRVLGTASYMSPEQAEGKAIDHRSDIFSLGIVLYEMATGERPFQGDSPISILSAILRDTPQRVSAMRNGLPRHLGRVIHRCLEKDPGRRYQTARDVRNELEALKEEIDSGEIDIGGLASEEPVSRPAPLAEAGKRPRASWIVPLAVVALAAVLVFAWWAVGRGTDTQEPAGRASSKATADSASGTTGDSSSMGRAAAAASDRPMIVVLPFENLGPADQAYFAAGITEEIIGRFATMAEIGVISRTTATQYDRSGKTVKHIGQDLGVDYVLEGTVRWAVDTDGAERVRITPRLIKVADDSQLWTQTYDREMDDIFAVQSNIASQVIEQLGVTLFGSAQNPAEDRPTENMEAYQAYLKSFDTQTVTLAEFDRVEVESLERATSLDPQFLQAWTRLSRHHLSFYEQSFDRSDKRLAQAKAALDRALAIDPAHEETLGTRGRYRYYGFRDMERALEDFQAVLALVPDDTATLAVMGEIHRSQGKWETALANYQKAVRLDPLNVRRLNELAKTYSAMRRFDEAQDTWARSIEIGGGCYTYYRLSGDVFRATGDQARAREVMEQCPANPDDYFYKFGNGFLRLYDRDWAAAREWFAQVKAEGPFMVGVRSILLATVEYYENERAGDLPRARECVAQMEAFLIDSPGAADQRSWLGSCHAFLGNAAAAQREGKLAVDLTAADLAAGPKMLNTLAVIYTLTGKPDEAWEIFERNLEAHYLEPLTRHYLRLDPVYDPFRDDPRFQALLRDGE